MEESASKSNHCLPHRGVEFAVNCGAPDRAAKTYLYKNTSSKTAGFAVRIYQTYRRFHSYYSHLNEFPSDLSSVIRIKRKVIGYVGQPAKARQPHFILKRASLIRETGIMEAVNINPLF
jgi:hypothetical protein